MIHVATVHIWTDMWIDLQLQPPRGEPRPAVPHLRVPRRRRARARRPLRRVVPGREGPALVEARRPRGADLRAGGRRRRARCSWTATPSRSPTSVRALDTMLAAHRLAAIRRTEILGDPSRTLPSAHHDLRFWQRQRRHVGPRTPGGATHAAKLVTDTGANLLKLLEDTAGRTGCRCRARTPATCTRSCSPCTTTSIYHHGAGFRQTLTRPEQAEIEEEVTRL